MKQDRGFCGGDTTLCRPQLHIWQVASLIAAIVFLCGCNGRVTRKAMATVLQSDGAVSIIRDGKSFPASLSGDHSHLQIGDRIRTGAAGSIDLMALSGTLAHLAADSELLIEGLTVTKDGHALKKAMKTRRIRLRLSRGTLSAVVAHADERSRIAILTPHGRIAARDGSTFRLRLSGEKIRAICTHGTIKFKATGAASRNLIEAGLFLEYPGPDLTPKLAEESTEAVQAEVTETLDTETHLLSLQRREETAMVPWRR